MPKGNGYYNCVITLVLLASYAMGCEISEAQSFSASVFSPLRIIDTIPRPSAGIDNSARVHDDTSVAVLTEADYGINLTDPNGVRFLIDDGEHGLYERNLNSPAVRLVEVENGGSQALLLWVVYDRSLDPDLPPVYARDTVVQIDVDVEDFFGNKLPETRFAFKIESDSEQADAFDHLPQSRSFEVSDPEEIHDSGIEIVSGALTGARILYAGDEPLLPAFGATHEIAAVSAAGGKTVGLPLNLMPHTVFDHPVKLFIPIAAEIDLNKLDIYYHNGVQWLAACDANGNTLLGGRGWMVPGSRVNHTAQVPPLIEIEVYHFSAAQGVVAGSSSTIDDTDHDKNGSGAVIYVSCFIDTAAPAGTSLYGFWSLLGLMGLIGLSRLNVLNS